MAEATVGDTATDLLEARRTFDWVRFSLCNTMQDYPQYRPALLDSFSDKEPASSKSFAEAWAARGQCGEHFCPRLVDLKQRPRYGYPFGPHFF